MTRDRVLLINPWIHDFAAYDFWLRPMGLLYLATVLRRWGFEIDFVDCLDRWNPRLLEWQGRGVPRGKPDGRGKFYKEEIPKPPILKDILRRYCRYGLPTDIFLDELASLRRPDIILVTSSMTYWYPGIQETIALTRQVFPDVRIILGGAYATLMPEHAKAHGGADYVVEANHVEKLREILEKVTGRQLAQASGIFFPGEEDRPAYDLLHNTSSIVIYSSWGCPFRCTYCASWKISGNFRQRSPRFVLDEIELLSRQHGAQHFVFFDDALLFDAERHFKPMMKEVISRGIEATFHTPNAIHPRYIDAEVASLMREANFQTVRLGLETVSSYTQRSTGAKVTNGDFVQAVSHLERAGFCRKDIDVYAMMGLPEQGGDEVGETLRFINHQGCTIRLVSYSPIPGTEEWGRAVAESERPLSSDPLLHNPSIYPVRTKIMSWEVFEELKALAAGLNTHLPAEANCPR